MNSTEFRYPRRIALLILAGFWAPQTAFAGAAGRGVNDLTELSIQELMEVEVTSVSRKGQPLSKTASAVYVITAEDIRRSGATSIPEALRMAPGVQVAQVNANKWAIGIRGFNSLFSNKLLVMVDGRSVYNPIFAGVYWDIQDMILEDIDHIEVVRGPGGTMWGSNAVNGIINIITKSADQTQGGLLTAGWGNQEGSFGQARFGGKAGSSTHYRVHSKFFRRPGQHRAEGGRAEDDWDMLRGGFRADWSSSERDSLMVTADVHGGEANAPIFTPVFEPPFRARIRDHTDLSGSNILARWTRKHTARSTSNLQVYYDRQHRRGDSGNLRLIESADFDYQNQFDLSSTNQVMWGGGYRRNRDDLENIPIASFHPSSRTTHLYQAFVQDEIRLFSDRLLIAVGTKVERNSFSGWEVQPSANLLWDRGKNDSAWLSVARAVRTPSRVTADAESLLQVFPGAAGLNRLVYFGNPDFKPEELISYQAGYRVRLRRAVSLDLTAFHNDYDNIEAVLPGMPFFDPSLPLAPTVIPLRPLNGRSGRTRGLEAASTWRLSESSQLHASYSWLDLRLRSTLVGVPDDVRKAEDAAPNQQFHARWYQDLPGRLQFDNSYYFVGSRGTVGLPAYHRVDSRIGWRPSRSIEFTFGLQNALDNQHPEAVEDVRQLPTEIGRSVYGKITYGF